MRKVSIFKFSFLVAITAIVPSVAIARPIVSDIHSTPTTKTQYSTQASRRVGAPELRGRYVTLQSDPSIRGYLAYQQAVTRYEFQLASYQEKVARIRAKNEARARMQRQKEERKAYENAMRNKYGRNRRSSGGSLFGSQPPKVETTPQTTTAAQEKPANVLTKKGDVEQEGSFFLRRKSEQPAQEQVTEVEPSEENAKPSLWTHFRRALIGH